VVKTSLGVGGVPSGVKKKKKTKKKTIDIKKLFKQHVLI
jgi:hypothetical protein